MKHEYIEQYNWMPELEKCIGAIDFLVGASNEILPDIRKWHQWPNIDFLIRSAIYRENWAGGGGRSLEQLKYWTDGLRIKGYSGRPRKSTHATDEKNLPSHNPEIDNAILASGTTTSPEAVKEANIFLKQGVNLSLITATTPKILEERLKRGETKESVWDHFKEKYGDWNKRVVYLFQDDTEEKKELASLNTPFERKLGLISIGLVNSIDVYHDRYDVYPGRFEGSETIPLIAISNTISNFLYYFKNRVVRSINRSQKQIYKVVEKIAEAHDIRHVSPYLNFREGTCFEIRLGNLGYNKEGKTVRAITSENYGSEGSSDLRSDTLLFVIALEGTEVFAYQIMKEAKKKRVRDRIYVGDSTSKIAKYATLVIPIPEPVHRYKGVINLGYPAIGFILDGITAAVKYELGMTEQQLRENHSQHG